MLLHITKAVKSLSNAKDTDYIIMTTKMNQTIASIQRIDCVERNHLGESNAISWYFKHVDQLPVN